MTKVKYEMPELSKEVLLSPEDTRMWCEHLCQVHCSRVNGEKKKASANRSQKSRPKGKSHIAARWINVFNVDRKIP